MVTDFRPIVKRLRIGRIPEKLNMHDGNLYFILEDTAALCICKLELNIPRTTARLNPFHVKSLVAQIARRIKCRWQTYLSAFCAALPNLDLRISGSYIKSYLPGHILIRLDSAKSYCYQIVLIYIIIIVIIRNAIAIVIIFIIKDVVARKSLIF